MKLMLSLCGLGLALSCGAATTGAGSVSLATALDNSNLVWTTGGDASWYGTNDVSFNYNTDLDGVDAAVSGNRMMANSVSWLQTMVVGPGMLSFWWKVSSDELEPERGILEFQINGVTQEGIYGGIDWNYRIYDIPPGTNVVQWQYVKVLQQYGGSDQAWVDQVIYTTNPPISLQNALNACGAAWRTGGNTNTTYWSGETNVTHDGSMAAQSGAISHLQLSQLQTTVSGVTNVSFWWKVSSNTNIDALRFIVDGTIKASISGEVNWQPKSYALTAGTHTLTWQYDKTNDLAVYPAVGQDRGWVDQVVFNPSLPTPPFTLLSPTALPDGRFSLVVSNEVGCPCRVQYVTNLTETNWTTLASITTTNAIAQIVDSGATNSDSRFYRTITP